MHNNTKLRGRLLISVVSMIIVLMVADTIIIIRNNKILEVNRQLQQDAEMLKVRVSNFATNIIHNLDLGIRSYALFGNEKYLPPLAFALHDKDSIFNATESVLRKHGYPLDEFNQLKDSINAYAAFCVNLKALYNNHEREEFFRLADMDKGYKLWLQYEQFSHRVYQFVDRINEEANHHYNTALKVNYLVQAILLAIGIPALLFMTSHTIRKFSMANELRNLELERAELLEEQNNKLDKLVNERTAEINLKNSELEIRNKEALTQNEELAAQQEEITSQRDMLALQNEKISEASRIIEEKNKEIQSYNRDLEKQVQERTSELVLYNQQLEKFTFMAAHDLRAPVARILGLGRIFPMTSNPEDVKALVNKISASTLELDQVINDLSRILEVRTSGNHKVSEINLDLEYKDLQAKLKREILDSKATIVTDFSRAPAIQSVKRYFKNIVYHVLHNALKFRGTSRSLQIYIASDYSRDFVCVSFRDNGIGINLELHKNELFKFHKRFHTQLHGRGLGLYLVKIQMKAIQGSVEIDSEVDKGTTVKLYFPKRFPDTY